MAEFARNEGVPDDAMILESNSTTIHGNVKESLNLFDDIGFEWQRMMLIMSPYAMRRANGAFQKFTLGKKFIRIGVTEDIEARDTWFTDEDTVRRFMNDFVKLRVGIATNTI